MSVLIKMEMPKNCMNCDFQDVYTNSGDDEFTCELTGNSTLDYFEQRDGRLPTCPLIPVPPHGRLIDADELRLLFDFHGYTPAGDMTEEEFDRLMCRLPVIRQSIDDAPTIIEREE